MCGKIPYFRYAPGGVRIPGPVSVIEVNPVAAPPRSERVALRLAADPNHLIEPAAIGSGLTVSGFILGSTSRQAREVLRETTVIELSRRDRDRFLAALNDDEAKPSPALRRAAKRHKPILG
jgi:uncharacterized protein (DUF1778 family)